MATRKRRLRLPKSKTPKKSPPKILDATAATRLVQKAAPKKPSPKKPPPKNPPPQRTASALLSTANARAAQARKQAQQDLKQAKSLIERIKRDFYDLGLVLTRLKQPLSHSLLGYDTFGALVDAELDISRAHADNLSTIATEVSRDLAEGVGPTTALALVRLCRAMPGAGTPERIQAKKVKLPNGEILDVKKATSRELRAGAAAFRQKRDGAPRRGKTTSPEERAAAKKIRATLDAKNVPDTRIRAIATKPGQEALLEIRIPFSHLSSLCQALCP